MCLLVCRAMIIGTAVGEAVACATLPGAVALPTQSSTVPGAEVGIRFLLTLTWDQWLAVAWIVDHVPQPAVQRFPWLGVSVPS